MKRVLFSSSLLIFSLLLAGCISRGDSLAPIVTMDPPSGAVRRADNLRVNGYAMDDEGIVSIRVNNTDLLSSDIYKGEKGKKLIQFSFRPRSEGNQFVSSVTVQDTSGRVTQRNYELQIDTVPPTVELLEVTDLGGSRLRVRGVARDNDLLKSITVAGQSAPFVPVAEREFNLDVDIGETMNVEVEDRAGNRTSQPLNP